jgi:hypothetical protein
MRGGADTVVWRNEIHEEVLLYFPLACLSRSLARRRTQRISSEEDTTLAPSLDPVGVDEWLVKS